jgi:hypothetical protein
MTREEFIKVLDEKGYSYAIKGDRVIVTHSGGVYLDSLRTLPQGIEFNNGRGVNLESLRTLPQGIEFNNGGYVNLMSLIGGWLSFWEGNIEGIKYKRLLNKMISLGLFDKKK